MGYIILVRHGQALSNVERRLAGRMDGIPLTAEGVRQAEEAASLLKSAGSGRGISAIYSSPIKRAADTADIMAKKCGVAGVTIDKRLTEIEMGSFTGMTFEQIRKEYGNIFERFYNHDAEIEGKGVESFRHLRSRITDMMREVKSRDYDGDVVLVTHKDPVVAVLAEELGISSRNFMYVEVANAALNIFRKERDGRLSILALNLMDPSRFATFPQSI